MRIKKENIKQDKIHFQVSRLLKTNPGKRIMIVGTTCTGKTTLVDQIIGAIDMDKLLFPKLTKAEKDYVCSKPWTEEIGNTMIKLAKESIKVRPGVPLFGTVVLDCDLVIYLKINDKLLLERTRLRGVSFTDAKNMQKQIEREVRKSGIRTEELIL